jgi:hypothetical protein
MHTLSHVNLIGKPLMAFGNDSIVSGSRKALFNLKQSMLKKGVYAVGEFLVRKTSPSRMVALVPQQDSHNEGFLIIPLPFKEELRSIANEDIGCAESSVVEAASRMVSKAVINSDEQFASMLPANPYLGYFFNFLESVSLGVKLYKPEDEARMNDEVMLENARQEIEDFALSLPEDEGAKNDKKRKQPASTGSKKYNVNVPSVPIEQAIPREWIEMWRNDEIADCTAAELKEFLRSIGERLVMHIVQVLWLHLQVLLVLIFCCIHQHPSSFYIE